MPKHLEWDDLGPGARAQLERDHPDLAREMKGDKKEDKERQKALKELKKWQERTAKSQREYEKTMEMWNSPHIQGLLANLREKDGN